jgi:hypothetical protein
MVRERRIYDCCFVHVFMQLMVWETNGLKWELREIKGKTIVAVVA